VALAVLVATIAAVAFAVAGTGGSNTPEGTASGEARRTPPPPPPAPAPAQLARAADFARSRTGNASFAVVDTDGRLQGVDARRAFASASVVKAMILVAYLDMAGSRDLTDTEEAGLTPMIRRSDNASAAQLVSTVGAPRLRQVARRAGMRGTTPLVRPWGLTETTAEDQARLFARIDTLVPARHRSFSRRLLTTITPEHRWGIPRSAPRDATVLFKGGWLPDDEGAWRVHQIAKVERGGRQLAVAVMTDDNPSQDYGEATVRGIADRLLK
jgi:beta-lactamase class A